MTNLMRLSLQKLPRGRARRQPALFEHIYEPLCYDRLALHWQVFVSSIWVRASASPEIRGTYKLVLQSSRDMAVPRLFPEIIDQIIDMLPTEPSKSPALYSCSLVCRQWLNRCRVHIHAAVRLSTRRNLEQLSELYMSPLALYVKSLNIDVCVGVEPAPHPWIDQIRPLLEHFTQIERLTFYGIVWDMLEKETQGIFLTRYPLVTDLSTSICDFWVTADFVQFLQAFPRLNRARMKGMVWEKNNFRQALHRNAPELHLQWLDVGEICTAPYVIARWAAHHDVVSIENIHFSWASDHPSDLGILLQKAGSTVQTLSITMDDRIQHWLNTPGEP